LYWYDLSFSTFSIIPKALSLRSSRYAINNYYPLFNEYFSGCRSKFLDKILYLRAFVKFLESERNFYQYEYIRVNNLLYHHPPLSLVDEFLYYHCKYKIKIRPRARAAYENGYPTSTLSLTALGPDEPFYDTIVDRAPINYTAPFEPSCEYNFLDIPLGHPVDDNNCLPEIIDLTDE